MDILRDRLKEKLPRLFLTLLLSSGLSLSCLTALDLSFSLSRVLLLILAESLLLEALTLTRRSLLWGGPALVAGLLLWLTAGSGLPRMADLFRAFSLRLSGVPGALPLVSREAVPVFTALLTLLGFLSARKSVGALPSMVLAVGGLLLVWQSGRTDLVPFLLPLILSALCLLLLNHHPETSLFRILPWAAVLLLLVWALTPREGLVIPALKERADEFRQAVMDRLFFTEPREVFSLSSEGFYPQGVSQLGGPASPTDHPVMQVSTPRTVYLRGVVFNEYDGRSWRNTLGGRRFLWDSPGLAGQRDVLFNQSLPSAGLTSSLTEARTVSVRMLSESASTLFVPQRVRDLRSGGGLVPYYTNSSELFITRNLLSGDTWSVSAPLFQAGDPGLSTLVDAAGAGEDPEYADLLETYTALPSHLEEPVWQLAADIVSGLSSPYEQAFALQNYLSRNYRYTLDTAPQSPSVDFVTGFLFDTKEGYCTYFASALTVLCRMAGLPARYVEGYLAEPDASGEALVTGLNAHAWTEVYFRGFGWLTLDATPRRSGGADSGNSSASPSAPPPEQPSPEPSEPPEDSESPEDSEETPPAPTPEAEASPAPEDAPESPDAPEEPDRTDAPVLPFLPWLLLLLLLPAAAALRWFLTSPDRKEKRLSAENLRFDLWMEDVLLRLRAAGFSRRTGETLMAFTRRLEAETDLPGDLARLGECASLLRYGRVQALDSDTALARSAARALRKALPFRARLRYALRRLKGGTEFPTARENKTEAR